MKMLKCVINQRTLIAGATTLMLSGFSASNLLAAPAIEFGEILVGFNSQYHEQPTGSGVFRQDLSGAARNRRNIIFVDDGGSPSEFNFVRVMPELPDNAAVDLPLTENHKDLEGATVHRGHFVITTSLSSTTDPDQRRLTRFRVNRARTELTRETSVDLREPLMEAMREHFGDEWFDRIKDEPGKSGGLNIEAISRPKTGQNFLMWGLRSPLFGDMFGNPATNPSLSLFSGQAIIAKVHSPFSDYPSFDFQTVSLSTEFGDHGIRGMEWIPKLHGYVLIGGPVPKADGYSLWRLRHNGNLERFELEGFDELCRPESVIQVKENGKHYLVVLSEESGSACDNAPFTIIMAEIL